MIIKKPKRKIPKLNLIPILDSVFIFIFFLLMSTQFIEIYEIGSESPTFQNATENKTDEEPLNLVLAIENDSINILTGLKGEKYKKIEIKDNSYDFRELQKTLLELKKENIKERTVRLRPHHSIEYEDIVQIIDHSRKINTQLFEEDEKIKLSDKKEETLFDNVVFENVM